jgi:hypothetical protein
MHVYLQWLVCLLKIRRMMCSCSMRPINPQNPRQVNE